MIDCVIQPTDEAQRGQGHQAVTMKDHPGPNPDQDNADVFDRVIGQQPFKIVFHQGVEHAQES